jgi:hydrogenase expression/formation protein HypC
MCLGIPSKVIQIGENGQGKVDYLGTKLPVNLSLMDKINIGDWVIVHAGFAITRMKAKEARETLALLREMAEKESALI